MDLDIGLRILDLFCLALLISPYLIALCLFSPCSLCIYLFILSYHYSSMPSISIHLYGSMHSHHPSPSASASLPRLQLPAFTQTCLQKDNFWFYKFHFPSHLLEFFFTTNPLQLSYFFVFVLFFYLLNPLLFLTFLQ